MKGGLTRSRSARGPVSPSSDSSHKEREPFHVGPYRPSSAPAVVAAGRRSRHNSENVPPDASANVQEGSSSPAQTKPAFKGATKSSKDSLQNSPSLPPRPPRPSPARSASNGLSSNQSFEQGSAKRKINWDLQSGSSTEGFSLNTAAAGDTASSTDSGVKASFCFFFKNVLHSTFYLYNMPSVCVHRIFLT
jgi:hypothetical protein